LPGVLLALLIGLQVVLAAEYHASRNGLPVQTYHEHYKEIRELTRMLDGYEPIVPDPELHAGTSHYYLGARNPVRWAHPVTLYQELVHGRLRGLWRNPRGSHYWNEIPTPLFVAAVVSRLGRSTLLAELTPMLYLALLLVSLYGIGRLAAGPWEGLAAAAVASGYPAVFGYARILDCTMSVMALAACLVFLLLSSEGFSKTRYAVGAGIVGALSVRTGEAFASVGLIGAIAAGAFGEQVWTLIRRLRSERGIRIRELAGLAVAVGLPLLALQWDQVPGNIRYMASGMQDHTAGVLLGGRLPGPGETLAIYLVYPYRIVVELLGPWMTLWAIAGLVLLYRSPARHRLAVLLMFALPFPGLCHMTRKATWYLAPTLPALALVTVLGLRGLRRSASMGIRRRLHAGGEDQPLHWRDARMRWPLIAAAGGVLSLLYFALAPAQWRDQLGIWGGYSDVPSRLHVDSVALVPQQHARDEVMQEIVRDLATQYPRGAHPSDGVHLVGLCSSNTTHAMRFAVEAQRPYLLMVDLLDTNAHPRPYEAHEIDAFDAVFIPTDQGILPWDEPIIDAVRGEFDAIRPEAKGRAHAMLQQLYRRPRIRVDLPSGPLYELLPPGDD